MINPQIGCQVKILRICGSLNSANLKTYCVRKSKIHKLANLPNVRKFNKFCNSANLRICDQLIADRPPLYNTNRTYDIIDTGQKFPIAGILKQSIMASNRVGIGIKKQEMIDRVAIVWAEFQRRFAKKRHTTQEEKLKICMCSVQRNTLEYSEKVVI